MPWSRLQAMIPSSPIYGKTYLPRKFKTAFALPEDNCTDIHANDLGFLGVVQDQRLVGLQRPGRRRTRDDPECTEDVPIPCRYRFVTSTASDVLEIGEAILKVYRDFGNRSDRKRARLKYIIHDWGLPAFRDKVEEYLGHPIQDPKPVTVQGVDDHLGWHSQGDGKLFLGIPVENGRIKDEGTYRLASGLRAFFQKYKTPGRLTCQQSILLADLDPAWRQRHRELARRIRNRHRRTDLNRSTLVDGLPCPPDLRTGRDRSRTSPARPARSARGRAQSTRPGSGTFYRADDRLSRTAAPDPITRISAWSAGRPTSVPTELPDRAPIRSSWVAAPSDDRLNVEYKDYVPYDQVVAELGLVLSRYKEDRLPGESFGDYCQRIGVEELARICSSAESQVG